jgi:hypothetical protein
MKLSKRLIAEVPSLRQAQGIRWLILEEDAEHTGGWYLYGHQDLNQGSDFDSWHLTRLEALQEAIQRWGVIETDWKPDQEHME